MEERIGPYTVVEELGRGGMGVVYKAHDPSLDRFVAIKVLATHLTEDPDYVKRFVREARAAAALNHPNIVQIYTVGEEDGRHYFVMEYVSGTNVQEMIRREGRLDPARAAGIVLQAASGLAAAHQAGILHRDIKPGNLMVDERGIVKIADFGLALSPDAATRLTTTGMLMGTPGYLSPEQCMDRPADRRSDIYSLGATFFEMLAGRTPHQADSPLALLRKIVDVEPPDVAELNPEVDPELRRIVSTMMAKDPDQRYQSCDEIVTDLRRWMEVSGAGSSIPAAGASRAAAAVASGADAPSPMEHTPTVMVKTSATERATPPPPPPPLAPPAPPAAAAADDAPPPPTELVQPAPPAASSPPRGRTVAIAAIVLLVLLGLGAAGVVAWRTVAGHRGTEVAAASTTTGGATATGSDTATAPEGFGDASGVEVEGGAPPQERQQPPTSTPSGTAATASSASGAGAAALAATTGRAAQGGQGVSGSAASGHAAGTTQSAGAAASVPPAHAAAASSASAASQPAAAAGRPASGTLVLAVGEELAAEEAAQYLRQRLARAGIDLVEIDDFPRALDLVENDPSPPTNAILSRLHGQAANLVLVRVKYEGSRELNYLGRGSTVSESGRVRMTGSGLESQRTYTGGNPDQVHRSRLTVTCYDLATTHTLAPRWSTTVEYTPLNAGRNVEKALGDEAGNVIDLLRR